MGNLIKYELKKMLSKRVTQISTIAVMLVIAAATWLNISYQFALDPNHIGQELEGTAAIAQQKAAADSLAGPITDEKATEVIAELQSFIGDDGDIKDAYRWDTSNPSPEAKKYRSFHATYGSYISLLTAPWASGPEMPVAIASRLDTSDKLDLYGQVYDKVDANLSGSDALFTYSEAEKSFWLDKAKAVHTPVTYGYAGGWDDFLNMSQFLIFALLATIIACASVFNIEYRERMDAILLSTKLGKSKLGPAKVIAAFLVASGVYILMVLIELGMILTFFGTDGAGLPIQIRDLSNAYNINMASATFVTCLAGYIAMLGLLGIAMLLSSKIKSSMGILAVAVAIVLVPPFIPNLQNSLANHIVYLFPFYAIDGNRLFDLVSFSIGPVVIEYPVFCMILYALLFFAGAVLAMKSFKKHQVA